MTLFQVFLFLHVLGAIVAFGPSFAMPVIGKMGGSEPMHSNFAVRVSEAISKQRIIPVAIFQGITGVGLVLTSSMDVSKAAWLLIAVVLYLIALGYGIFIQTPNTQRLITLTTMPAGGPPPGAPAGPPPGVPEAVKKVQRGGAFMGILIVIIVFLMVVKPSFG
jgi:hypothetical protein